MGIVEVIYFGFFCFEPSIWPDATPPDTCHVPFTFITAWYVLMILCISMPLRILLNCKSHETPEKVSFWYALITVSHMFLCLSWLIFALVELKGSDKSCWEPFTW